MRKVNLTDVSTEDLLSELLKRPGVVRSVFTVADVESILDDDEDTADLSKEQKDQIATTFIDGVRRRMEDILNSRGNAFLEDNWHDEKKIFWLNLHQPQRQSSRVDQATRIQSGDPTFVRHGCRDIPADGEHLRFN
jgi:hypothetical protein